MTYASKEERDVSLANVAPVRLSEIIEARQLMRGGMSMKEAADRIGIVPSGRLDVALWNHLGDKDADLLAAAWMKVGTKG